MKTIQFHVGSGRCGSTLIQALFNDAGMHRIFDANSIKYDPNIYLEMGKLTPLETFDKSVWKPIRENFFAPMEEMPFDTFFVTQENLFGAHEEKGSTNTCEASCELIEYLTEGYDTKIVMLVRRQDTYIESLYNMLIKRWERRDFATYLDDIPLANLDWAAVADVYVSHFGKDNVTVLPFEKAVLKTGKYVDFVAAMLATIGVAQNVSFGNVPTVNPSLAPRVIEVQRLANKLLTKNEAHALANWFEHNIPKEPASAHSLMTEDQRQKVLDFFRAPNERLGAEYMPAFDTSYYLG